jgi:hypothetical protein
MLVIIIVGKIKRMMMMMTLISNKIILGMKILIIINLNKI